MAIPEPEIWPYLATAFFCGLILSGLIVGLLSRWRARRAVRSWSERYSVVESSLNKSIDRVHDADAVVATTRERADRLQAQLSASHSKTRELTQTLEKAQSQVREVKRQHQQESRKGEGSAKQLANLSLELSALRAQVEALEAKELSLTARASERVTSYNRLSEELDARIKMLSTTRYELTRQHARISELGKQLDDSESERTRDAQAFAALRDAKQVDDQRIEWLTTQLHDNDVEIRHLRNRLEERDEAFAQSQQELFGTRKRVPQLERLLIDRDEALRKLGAQIRERDILLQRYGEPGNDGNRAASRPRPDDRRAAKTAVPLFSPTGQPDDLKRIKGIGPKLEALLNSIGIYQFGQIAKFSDSDIRRISKELSAFKMRITDDRWIDQASQLQEGTERAGPRE